METRKRIPQLAKLSLFGNVTHLLVELGQMVSILKYRDTMYGIGIKLSKYRSVECRLISSIILLYLDTNTSPRVSDLGRFQLQ